MRKTTSEQPEENTTAFERQLGQDIRFEELERLDIISKKIPYRL